MSTTTDLPFSLIRKAVEITGWSHAYLSELLAMPRSSVQAICAGKYTEYLDARQSQALMDAVRLHRDQIIQGVAEMEMM
jgi:ribosome-binding protein aMBF1 (putative translation factor)